MSVENRNEQMLSVLCNERTTAFNRRLRTLEDRMDSMQRKLENYPTMEYLVEEVVVSNKELTKAMVEVSLTMEKVSASLCDLDNRYENLGHKIDSLQTYTKEEISDLKEKIDIVDNKSKIDIVTTQKGVVQDNLHKVFLVGTGAGLAYAITELVRYIF